MNFNSIPASDWMSALPGSMPVTQVNMPGTHDGAVFRGAIIPKEKINSIKASPLRFAAGAAAALADAVVNPITICQSASVTGQLEMGVRVLDIRIDYKGSAHNIDVDNFYVFHGPTHALTGNGSALSFTQLMQCCEAFLLEHKSETVVVLYNAENDKRDEEYKGESGRLWNRAVHKMLLEYGSDKNKIILKNGDPVPCVEQCRGKIILIDAALDVLKFEDSYEARYDEKINILKKVYSSSVDQIDEGELNVSTDFYSPEPRLVFTNCYWCPDLNKYIKPKALSVAVSSMVSVFHLQKPQSKPINSFILGYDFKKGIRYGWVMLNFATPELCSAIYKSNITQ